MFLKIFTIIGTFFLICSYFHRNDYSIPHNIFAIAAWKKCIFWNWLLRCKHLMENIQDLLSWSQRLNKLFPTKSRKDDTIYMGIIYMSFLLRNLLCKNIHTMSSLMWSNELFSILKWWLYLYCIFLFSFLTYEVSYSKNKKFFRNVEFIFAIGFETVFCRTYSCDWLIQNCILMIKFLQFRAKIIKISSAIIYSATIYD